VKGPPQHKKAEEKKAETEDDVEQETDGAEDDDGEDVKDKKKPGSHVRCTEMAQAAVY